MRLEIFPKSGHRYVVMMSGLCRPLCADSVVHATNYNPSLNLSFKSNKVTADVSQLSLREPQYALR